MRVLFLTQYFAPEVGATQSRTLVMARALVDAGHHVTLICEVPNHPKGRIWPDYRGTVFKREDTDGIEIIRVWVRASPEKTTMNRIAFYASYMAMAIVAGVTLVRGPHDIIFATSPPLFVAVAGGILGLLRRSPFVMEVRDPWPAAAEAMGELRGTRAIAIARRLETFCLRRAKHLITVTNGWRRLMVEQGVPKEKITVVPNGADTAVFRPRPAEAAELRATLNLEGKFVAVYLGLHGLAQGLDIIVNAAERLRATPDVVFFLVGEGPRKAELVARSRQKSLANLRFHAQVPGEVASAFLSMADVALVSLRQVELFKGMVPAKLFDAWACGCPVIAAAEGEVCDLVRKANGGIIVEPENDAALANAIKELRANPSKRAQVGITARRFVESHCDRAIQAKRFVDVLQHAAQ